MSRSVRDAKWSLWRRRMAKFGRSGLTVVAFCEAEGVSQPTFYLWKRKLAGESVSGTPASKAKGSSGEGSRPTFLPVRIEVSEAAATARTATVEVELPNGARVRVPAGELRALDAVVVAAGRLTRPSEAEVAPC